MLPSAHIEFTWGVLNLLQRRTGRAREVDYRLAALAASLPDLIDKPLAVFVFPNSKAALLFSHTLLLHLLVWGVTLWRGRRWLPYALAFSGHLILDRLWDFPKNLWYPLLGWEFHQWRDVGSPKAALRAYTELLDDHPEIIAYEVIGLGILGWFVCDRQLFRWGNLLRFLRTGKTEAVSD
jgi:hypothetical protein